jgi:hypothetical protein
MDLFKIEQYFKPKQAIEMESLTSHLNQLKKFTFSKNRNKIKGTFKSISDLFNLRFSSLLKTEFYIQENQLTEFKISPNNMGKLILYGYSLSSLIAFINVFSVPEYENKIGIGIVGLGFLGGVYIVRRILISEVKYVRNKLNIE